MPEVKITAESRNEFGKGAARRSRREGRVPAVLYGHGTETRHLSLPGHDLMLALKTPNVLLRLEGLTRGGEIAAGDGMLNQQLVQIALEADATNIPQGIDVDVDGMDVGQAVHASDLKLPPGVSLQVEPETLVLAVIAKTMEEPAEAEAGEVPEVPEALAETAGGSEGEQAG